MLESCKTLCKLHSCSASTQPAIFITKNDSRCPTSDSGAIGSWLQHQGVVLQDLGQVLALLGCHLHMPYTYQAQSYKQQYKAHQQACLLARPT